MLRDGGRGSRVAVRHLEGRALVHRNAVVGVILEVVCLVCKNSGRCGNLDLQGGVLLQKLEVHGQADVVRSVVVATSGVCAEHVDIFHPRIGRGSDESIVRKGARGGPDGLHQVGPVVGASRGRDIVQHLGIAGQLGEVVHTVGVGDQGDGQLDLRVAQLKDVGKPPDHVKRIGPVKNFDVSGQVCIVGVFVRFHLVQGFCLYDQLVVVLLAEGADSVLHVVVEPVRVVDAPAGLAQLRHVGPTTHEILRHAVTVENAGGRGVLKVLVEGGRERARLDVLEPGPQRRRIFVADFEKPSSGVNHVVARAG